jgi:hypothetical protein
MRQLESIDATLRRPRKAEGQTAFEFTFVYEPTIASSTQRDDEFDPVPFTKETEKDAPGVELTTKDHE